MVMSCEKPLLAVDYGLDPSTKKHRVKVIKYQPGKTIADYEELYGDSLLLLPCGRCPSCKEKRLKDWSVRCELEARFHELNSFITLTYDQEHCPDKLSKKDFQDFIKALRNSGIKCRYFGCGELSPRGRPHYHICLFGYFPSDIVYSHMSKSNEHIFKSEFIRRLWAKGLVSVQYFTSKTAGYCAGYTLKEKNTGFILMSKRPGIGEQYVKDNVLKILKTDNIVSKLGVVSVPRYFDKVIENLGYDTSANKYSRIKKASLSLACSMSDRSLVLKEEVYKLNGEIKAEKLKRLRRFL